MKIYIPEPCHENWGTMTLNEQGRFCGSCQKTVVDFTNFSAEDIQNYFTKHYGQKVCGRFKQQQLNSIDIQIPSVIFNQISFSRKFALALLLVFGTTLFSCTDNQGQPATLGEVKLVDTTKSKIDTALIGKTVIEPNNVKHPSKFVKENPSVKLQGEVEAIEEEIMGDTVMPTKPKEVLKGKVKISPPDTSRTNPDKIIHTMGMIAPEYKVEVIKINSN